jgi:cytochrome c5
LSALHSVNGISEKATGGEIPNATNKKHKEGIRMKHMKTRFVRASWLMAFVVVTFFAICPAPVQAQAMRFDVPYAFTFGAKLLPPGSYTFRTSDVWLIAQSSSGEAFNGRVLSTITGPSELLRYGSLVFEKSPNGRILSEVWIPGSNGLLVHSIAKGHDHDVLLVSSLSQTRAVSGKAAYSLTCARCHGADGKGEPEADKFFNTTIPRLSSAAVQSKTDGELREQIHQGSSAMPPVEVDEAGFRHRLPPQDVDAVIAYVRTLKQ